MKWEELLPSAIGRLPSGAPLPRTDPGGSFEAKIAILGAYPAATKVGPVLVDGARINLPLEVEAESFQEESASGLALEEHYLRPLSLHRDDVLITDMWPYFLANTTKSKGSGRSMADNIQRWEHAAGQATQIETRPAPEEFVRRALKQPGNLERLADYLGRCRPSVFFTLGVEAAAFVRKAEFRDVEAQAWDLFYADPVTLDVAGVEVDVVHLVHPHLFLKRVVKWTRRHEDWCRDAGCALVRNALGRRGEAAGW